MTKPTEQYKSFHQAVTKVAKVGFLHTGRLRLPPAFKDATLLERDSGTLERARTFLPESQIETVLKEYGVLRAIQSIAVIDPKREIVRATDEYGNEVLASPNPFQKEGLYYLPIAELVPESKATHKPQEPIWEKPATTVEVPTEAAAPEKDPPAPPIIQTPPSVSNSPVVNETATLLTDSVSDAPIDYAALALNTPEAQASPPTPTVGQSISVPRPPDLPLQTLEQPRTTASYTVPPSREATPYTRKRLTIATALNELGYGNVQAEEMSDPKLDQTLLKKRRITSEQAAEAQALARGLKYVDVAYDPPNAAVSNLLDENTCRSERTFPYDLKDDGTFIVLTDTPAKEAIIRTRVAERSGQRHIEVRVTSSNQLERLIREQYTSATALQDLHQELESSTIAPEVTLDASDNAVSRFVSDLILDGMNQGASDIHIEPTLGGLQVRFRIDGKLRPAVRDMIAASGMGNIVRVVKLMAKMDVGNNRIPQDNRITLRIGQKRLNLRVSSMPQNQGHEKIVMRLLKDAGDIPEIENLGMAPPTLRRFKEIIRKPEGLFLVTGPTGSGKSFTLYASMKRVATPDRNAQTLEDPIEYEIPGLNQAQMNPEVGYTFAMALRAAMRQDPDLLLLGEIRDRETANISLSMANTGHQVFSTLHTISAASAIQRLRDLGVEDYNISPSLQGVMAQRLIRRLCPHCAETAPLPERVSRTLQQGGLEFPTDQYRVANHQGCPKCDRGRRGRLPIHELLVVTPRIREMINDGAPTSQIEEVAVREGMISLMLDGYLKVAQGLFSIEDLENALNDIAPVDLPTDPTIKELA